MVKAVFDLFVFAGAEWVLWLLLGLSVLILGVVFDRWRLLRNQERVGARLWADKLESWVQKSVPSNWRDQAPEFVQKYPSLESELVLFLAELKPGQREQTQAQARAFIASKKLRLERGLGFLGTLGNNAPYIGLLGTVIGIVKAFHHLSQESESGINALSYGLAEALVSTAVGIAVALEAVVFFNFFQKKIKSIQSRSSSLADTLMGQ